MGIIKDLQGALREGLEDWLHSRPARDEVDEITGLLESDVTETRSALSLAEADEKRLKARIDQEMGDAERLREQARVAVDANDEEAGREMIRRRRRTLRGVEILEQQWTEHQQLIAELHEHLEELEDKLQEVRLRSDFLRTRNRVRALRERYERYRRDYGLDVPPLNDEAEFGAPPLPEADHPSSVDAPPPPLGEAEPRPHPRRSRRAGAEEAAPRREAETLSGLGEVPRPSVDEEPALRERAESDAEAEPEADANWDRRPRDMRLERERMLRQIERRQSSAEFESAIEDELAELKAAAAGKPAEPAPAEDEERHEPGAGA
jgi:phage shock protein A